MEKKLLAKLEEILDDLHSGVCITSGDGIVLYMGKSCETIYNVRPEKYLGKPVEKLQEEGIFNPSITSIAIKERKKVTMTQQGLNKQELLVTATPIIDRDTDKIECVISYTSWDSEDVAALKRHYDKLQKEIIKSTINYGLHGKFESGVHLTVNSSRMQRMMKQIDRIADSETQVLITGEEGTGKSRMARYIHARSERKECPFGHISCSVYSGQILEDELFGYVNVNPTSGEEVEKLGLCEILDGGTLLLEDIENMSSETQKILLSLLKYRYYYKRHGNDAKRVDVRIIATSTRQPAELEKLLKEGLYYRLSTASIEMPSLRERREDIASMIFEAVGSCNKLYHRNVRITEGTVEQMKKYSWPGNITELKSQIQKLVLTLDKEVIEEYDLPSNISPYSTARFAPQIDLNEYMEYYEGRLILQAYEQCKTTVKLAKYLGISQASAARKLKKYQEMNSKDDKIYKNE